LQKNFSKKFLGITIFFLCFWVSFLRSFQQYYFHDCSVGRSKNVIIGIFEIQKRDKFFRKKKIELPSIARKKVDFLCDGAQGLKLARAFFEKGFRGSKVLKIFLIGSYIFANGEY